MRNKESGFTLIELMIVVAIIGILASIAIPSTYHFRQKAFEDVLINDVRNAGTIEEALFAEDQNYTAFGPFTGTANATVFAITATTNIKISKNVTIQAILTGNTLVISATHPGATDPISYNTTLGGIQQ